MVEAVNLGDADAFAECYADDVVIRMMATGRTMRGRDAARQWIVDFFENYQGARNDIAAIHRSGDSIVVLEIVARGTRRTASESVAAGTEMNRPEAFVYHLRDGKISEVRAY
jgi:steroid delta-isomerase-like uncharacterized protein